MSRHETKERRTLTFLWRIENLSYWTPGFHGREINSNCFTPLWMDGIPLYLKVFPRGKDQNDPRLQIRLHSLDLDNEYSIDCEWSLLDDVGLPLITETLRNRNFKCSKPVDMPSCPTQEEVFVTRRSSFLLHDTLTVRCRIWKSRGDLEQAEDVCARTRIKVAKKSFVWGIGTFRSLWLGQKVTTRVRIRRGFSVFLLNFSLTGASLEDARVNFQIIPVKTGNAQLTLNVSILKEGKEMKCVEGKYVFRNDRGVQTWDLPKFVSRKEILNRTPDWLCGDDLNLLCKFVVVQKDADELVEKSYCGPTNLRTDIPRRDPGVTRNDRRLSKKIKLNSRHLPTFVEASTQTACKSGDQPDATRRETNSSVVLIDDFLTLYNDRTLFDFELRSGDVSFPVHKNVLSARSPVFRAMFCGDMKESDSTSQDVPDVDAHTLSRMLTFLYSGSVDDLQWEGAVKLYYAADKYQVPSLKKECLSVLRSGLSVSNVSDILELAERHQDQELTSFVHDFLLIHFDAIVLSVEWEKFLQRNSYLTGKTMMEIYKRKLQK